MWLRAVAFGASPECARIEPNAGGQTWDDPCEYVCGPLDVDRWRTHARAYIDASKSAPLSAEQRSQLATLEQQWASLGGLVPPWRYGDAVASYVAIAQGAACLTSAAMQGSQAPIVLPAPTPVPPEAPEEEQGWQWPTLPKLPDFPGFPKLGFPDLPWWVWLLALGLVVGVWSAPARATYHRAKRRRRERAAA